MGSEIWKVCDQDNRYKVSNTGRVLSYCHDKINGKIRALPVNSRGYCVIYFSGKSVTVHRIIARAFVSNPKNKPQVNHIDGDKTNNHAKNLEWCTQRENNIHACRTLGKKSYNRQLSNEQVTEIVYVLSGFTAWEVSVMLGVEYGVVKGIASGKNYNEITMIRRKNER